MRNRRYPVKCMFSGVVGNPILEKQFDGRIHLERVSKSTLAAKKSVNQRFSDDRDINNALKDGAWRDILPEGADNMFLFEITELIADSYGLDDAVMIRLVFVYTTCVANKGNTQPKYIEDHERIIGKRTRRIDADPDVPPIALTILDITMKVRVNVGDVIETEDTCDSEYMMGAMDRVGQSARKKYYWVPLDKFIFMVMDNAGGHGTKETVQLYTEMLKTKYNIIIIHQVPRSPYTNLLDLGVWCSLQAAVEKEHYMKRTDVHALQNSVMSAWDTRPLDKVIGKVWTRMTKVLALIVEGDGGNDLVEKKRGKRWKDLDLQQEFLEAVDETTAAATTTTPVEIYDLDADDEDGDDRVEMIIQSI